MSQPDPMLATCTVCGDKVSLLEAISHMEAHQQAGDIPRD